MQNLKNHENTEKIIMPKQQNQTLRFHCMLCGKSSPQTICEHCSNMVRAEAVEKKRKIEKETK
ncbi:MAG: hypothetical protein ACD_73C00347G0002 [uncultured bacterium]|nr:MAG: hypothetical protein ACD_73C00347G0002 [uncultured bacterium]